MPSELSDFSALWNLDVWPSPSSEAVVRARVLGRTRTITRRRLLPVAGALLLAALMAVTRLPGTESSSRVRMVDHGERDLTRVLRGGRGSVFPADGPSLSITPAARHLLPRPAQASTPDTSPHDGPAPAARPERGPILTDPQGDAAYGACNPPGCEVRVDGADSQAALDYLTVDVRCSAGRMELAVGLLDPDMPVHDRAGVQPQRLTYSIDVRFDDGDEGGIVNLGISRDQTTGGLMAGAAVYHSGAMSGSEFVGGVTVAEVGTTLFETVGLAELADITRTYAPDRRPFAPGARFQMSLVSWVTYDSTWQFPIAADQARMDDAFSLCD